MIERQTNITITYDAYANAAYIYLTNGVTPGQSVTQIMANSNIILDFDRDGHLIGIELLRGDLIHPDLRSDSHRRWASNATGDK